MSKGKTKEQQDAAVETMLSNLKVLLQEVRGVHTDRVKTMNADQINVVLHNALQPVLAIMSQVPVNRGDFFAVQLLRAYMEQVVQEKRLLTRRNSQEFGIDMMQRCARNIEEIIAKIGQQHKQECRHCDENACPKEEETEWPMNRSESVH